MRYRRVFVQPKRGGFSYVSWGPLMALWIGLWYCVLVIAVLVPFWLVLAGMWAVSGHNPWVTYLIGIPVGLVAEYLVLWPVRAIRRRNAHGD